MLRISRLPNGMDVFHRWIEVPNALYDEVQNYLANGIELREGDCVFDVGANIGVFSLLALERVGRSGRVFAFEPIPETFEVLRRNAENHGDVVRSYNLGISNACRDTTFHTFTFASGLCSMYATGNAAFRFRMKEMFLDKLHDPDVPEVYRHWLYSWLGYVPRRCASVLLSALLPIILHSRKVRCRLATLSEFIREHDVAGIDLLKIDVEMAELDVLHGIEPEHWPRIRQIAMEIHDIHGRVNTISKLLATHGFHRVHLSQEPLMKGTDIFSLTALRA
jgi:FkbM family methyltransferase